MSSRKGQLVIFFILVAAAGLLTLLILMKGVHVNTILNVKKTVAVSTDLSDKGTSVISLMNREYQGKKYIEVMGESLAKNYDKTQAAYLSLKDTLSKIGEGFRLYFDDNPDLNLDSTVKTAEKGECGHTTTNLGITLTWPSETTRVTSGFGYRNQPNPCYCHSGVDIASGGGASDEVYAALDGKVVSIYKLCSESPNCFQYPQDGNCGCNGGFGNRITLEHTAPGGEKFYTHYYHLRDVKVDYGQEVKAGDLIATTGNTGRSSGAHLHFELATSNGLKDGDAVNPCPYFQNAPSGCQAPQTTACSVAAGANVFAVDVPLPGANSAKLKGKVVIEKW